jgi:predicted aspartyl protease
MTYIIVDSGAVYSVLPESVWKRLRLQRRRSIEFSLADGSVIERGVSHCIVEIAGVSELSPVVLGGPRDAAFLGMKLMLAALTPTAA